MTVILLVEDTAELSDVIARELREAGYELRQTADGLSALAIVEQMAVDLIILDWLLPGLNGLETLRRLRRNCATPVLMLTARSEEADRVLGLEVGADDYLTKPFSMRELLARVRALLRRSDLVRQTLQADRSSGQMPLKRGVLYIDPQSFIVKNEGQTLDLTRTEILLLYLFVSNPGRAFNRDYLLDAVWGQGYIEGDRAVDNAILRLRKKLGSLGEQIETVWGIGYRWQDGL